MPSQKPRKRPQRPRVPGSPSGAGAARGRRGAYAESLRPELSAAAYRWRCPACPCTTNLRGLGRDECSRCGHQHFPDVPPAQEPTP